MARRRWLTGRQGTCAPTCYDSRCGHPPAGSPKLWPHGQVAWPGCRRPACRDADGDATAPGQPPAGGGGAAPHLASAGKTAIPAHQSSRRRISPPLAGARGDGRGAVARRADRPVLSQQHQNSRPLRPSEPSPQPGIAGDHRAPGRGALRRLHPSRTHDHFRTPRPRGAVAHRGAGARHRGEGAGSAIGAG